MKKTRLAQKHAARRKMTPARHAVLTPRCKIWLERDGKIALSDWRVALLELIRETGSLAMAAKRLHVPYRTAWYKLKDIEECLGIKLLVTESGGMKGGRSQLTAEAEEIVHRFRRVTAGVGELVERRFRDEFAD